jgi:iron complex transport system ATP-binding protein
MAKPLCVTGVTVERARRVVLEDVEFQTDAGSVLAILGPNGAGKTTLLEALAGFLPFRGEVLLDGQSIRDLPRMERARRLAYVPQISKLSAPMRVRDVVMQGRFAHHDTLRGPSQTDREAVQIAMNTADVARLADRPFTQISYGERRRVLLARALAVGARVILLDEPSASLDIGQAMNLFATLRKLAEAGHSIVAVLHQLDEALHYADRALLLANGRCIANGPVSEVVAREPVRHVYGVELVPAGGVGYRSLANAARP